MGRNVLTREQVMDYLLGESYIREGGQGLEMVYGEGCSESSYIHVNDSEVTGSLEMRIHLSDSSGILGKLLAKSIFGKREDIEICWAKEVGMTSEICRQIRSLDEVDDTLFLAGEYHGVVESKYSARLYRRYWDRLFLPPHNAMKRPASEEESAPESSSQ